MTRWKTMAIVAAAVFPGAARADVGDLTVSGFGTLGAVRINSDSAQFVRDLRQNSGAGKTLDFSVDSRLALQLDYRFDDAFSLTIQALAQKNRDGNFKPELEWANIKYRFDQAWSFRAGRMGTPLFLISDSRNVGYASPWVRPPVDVYSQAASSYFDGIDANWSGKLGGGTVRLQPYFGLAPSKLRPDFDVKLRKMAGLNSTYEYGAWLFRAGYMYSRLDGESPSLDSLFETMRDIGRIPGMAQWRDAAAALETRAKKTSFAGVGLAFDDDTWLVQAEYTQRRVESFIGDTDGWYATLGYRLGTVMPYLTHAAVQGHRNTAADSLLAPSPELAGLKSIVRGVSGAGTQKTTGVGVRWDVYRNIALKAQFDRIRTERGRDSWMLKPADGKSVNVYSLAADFVF